MITIVRIVAGAVLGAGFGFAMYKFVGCKTGACPLTGNPYIAMFVWGAMGAIIGLGK